MQDDSWATPTEDVQHPLPPVKKCFTSIQLRRVGAPLGSTVRLCPSMDLIAYGLQQQSHQPHPSPQHAASVTTTATTTPQLPPTLHIHRTLNWQKIAHVVTTTSLQSPLSVPTTRHPPPTDDPTATTTTLHVEWRPDGRCVAVAAEGGTNVALYSLEGLLKAAAATTTGHHHHDPSSRRHHHHPDGDVATGFVHSCALPVVVENNDHHHRGGTAVTALSWVHVGCAHPSWPDAATDDDDPFAAHNHDATTTTAVDRLHYVLPPSGYHGSGRHHRGGTSEDHDDDNDDNVLPTSQTPLSLLCVATATTGLHLFLHGRYAVAYHLPWAPEPWVTTTTTTTTTTTPIVASTDLTHLMTAASTPTQGDILSVLSIPALSKHRHELQTVSAQYGKIMQHLEAVRGSLPYILASWKSSLKAVDLKLDALQKLLEKYGLVNPAEISSATDADEEEGNTSRQRTTTTTSTMRSLLVQYILSGHTRAAPNLSNALDQFFTGVPMNDQLLQRMERSLAGAVGNVESSVRQQLLAPAMALVYEIDQLYGLAAYRSDLLSATLTLQLLRSAQQLLRSVETALAVLVQARSRLRDFGAWLRCTGAQIKARGTAANSVQRENAKKRRVPAAVVHRVLSYLQPHEPPPANEEGGIASGGGGGEGTTESVLGLRFADLLRETSAPVADLRPVSPASVQKLPAAAVTLVKATPTIPHVLAETSTLADKVFEYPRSFLVQSIQRTVIRLPAAAVVNKRDPILAVTTRLGQGGIDPDQVTYGEKRPEGFFAPRSTMAASNFRQWSVVAQVRDDSSLQLHAFPLTWTKTGNDDFDDDDVECGIASEFGWIVRLSLPSHYCIREIAFYGDDGKSSLSAGEDGGSGQEGRQRIGLLVSAKKEDGESQSEQSETTTERVELWLVSYDDLEFAYMPLGKEKIADCIAFQFLNASGIPNFAVRPMRESDDREGDSEATTAEDGAVIVFARTREVFPAVDFTATKGDRPCRLVLSGSRGIGAVSANQPSGTVLEVLDLEEDEEEDKVEEMDAEDEDV